MSGKTFRIDGVRPHIGVHMKCCHVYIHAYLNRDKSAFVAWCPRCASQVRVRVSEEGSSSRILEAS